MILPAPKYQRVTKGVTFSYPFVFQNKFGPISLLSWSGTWIITWPTGSSTLTSSATQGTSGVFFGGQSHTPANGMIDLVLVASDTAAIPWTSATYTLTLTDPLMNVYQLLTGGMGVI